MCSVVKKTTTTTTTTKNYSYDHTKISFSPQTQFLEVNFDSEATMSQCYLMGCQALFQALTTKYKQMSVWVNNDPLH